MRERCPHCSIRIDLRGPRMENRATRGKLCSSPQYFCRACGIRLKQVRSPLEHA